MPSLRARADTEAVLIAYLATDDDLVALVGGDDDPRIGQAIADDFPQLGRCDLQLSRATATDVDRYTGHLSRDVIQVNAYGPNSVDAFELWATADLALRQAIDATHVGAVITQVERLTGPTWSPDPVTACPRYLSSYGVFIHPIAAP